MLRDPIVDIVSDAIVVYLKANTVKSTAKQKDFQSKIRMFRKKIQELTEKFKQSDKLIENLKKTFVLSSDKVKKLNKEGYAERIYRNADLLNTVDKDIALVKSIQLSIEKDFGKNFDQSSVQDLQKTLKKMEIEREAKAQEAKDILHKLSEKEVPFILTYEHTMMERIRHYLEKTIKNLKIDVSEGKNQETDTQSDKVILESKNTLVVYSDVCLGNFKGIDKKGIIWTRYISIKNAPVKDDENGTVGQTVDTFLAVSVVLEKPKMDAETLEPAADFSVGLGKQNIFFINFINAKLKPSKIDLNSSYRLKNNNNKDVKEALEITSYKNNLDLFMDGESEEEVIVKTRDEILKLAKPFYSEYRNYKKQIKIDSLDIAIEDLDEEYKQDKEVLVQEELEKLKNYEEKFKETKESKKLNKDIEVLQKYINIENKKIYKILGITTKDKEEKENQKHKMALDYKLVIQYERAKESDRYAPAPTLEQMNNYKKYVEVIELENKLFPLKKELKDLEAHLTLREFQVKQGIRDDFVLERNKLESEYHNKKQQIIKNHTPPRVELIFAEDKGGKMFWLDNGLRLLFPLDVPESMDQFIKNSIEENNISIEKLQLKLNKLTGKNVQTISEMKKFEEEFVNYRNDLYKSEANKIEKDLKKREVSDKDIRKELNKFEKEFETEEVKNGQKEEFIKKKELEINREIKKINKAIEEHKNSKAKKILPAIENAPTETNRGKTFVSTKSVKSLPSDRWERKLLREVYLVFGIPFQFEEGEKAPKNRLSVSIKRRIIDYVPKNNPDIEPVTMYEYTFKIVQLKKDEFDVEKTTSILPDAYSLDTDTVEDTLKALEESGIPTKALSKKEQEKLDREKAENERLFETNIKKIEEGKYNALLKKALDEIFEESGIFIEHDLKNNKPIIYIHNKDEQKEIKNHLLMQKLEEKNLEYIIKNGKVIPTGKYSTKKLEDKIVPPMKESTDWVEEKPTVITRKVEEPVKRKISKVKKTQ